MNDIETEINTAIKGLTRRVNLKLEHIEIIENALANPDINNDIWNKYLNGNNTKMALIDGIYSPEMVKLLTLRSIILPEMLVGFLTWMTKRKEGNGEHFYISLEFQETFFKLLPSDSFYIRENITQAIINLFPLLLSNPNIIDGAIWLLSPDNSDNNGDNKGDLLLSNQKMGLWANIYQTDLKNYLNNALVVHYIADEKVRNIINNHQMWITINDEIKSLWGENKQLTFPKYLVFAKLFASLKSYYLSAFFYQASEGSVPIFIFNKIDKFTTQKIDDNSCQLYGIIIRKRTNPYRQKFKKFIPFLFIIIVSLVLAIYPNISSYFKPAEEYYQEGLNYSQGKEYSLAIEQYDLAIKRGLKTEDIYYQRALAHYNLKNYDQAIEDYRQVININNKNANAYLNRGNIYWETQEFDKAIYDYTQLINIDNKSIIGYQNRAKAYEKINQIPKAIYDYTQLINLDNKSIEFYKKRADAYERINEISKAIYDYTQVINLGDTSIEAYKNRIRLYEIQGLENYPNIDYPNIIKDYTKIINLGDTDISNYQARGDAYYQLKQYAEAIEDFNVVISKDKNNSYIYFRRAYSHAELGDNQKAIDDYTQVIKLDPKDDGAYNNRGNIYRQLGNYQQALNDYTKAINLNSKQEYAYENRGRLYYYNLKQYNKAIYDFTQAIKVDNKNKEAYKIRGDVYADLGDIKKAISDFTQAINIDKNYADSYYNRGLAYLKVNQKSSALNDFRKAAQLYFQQGDNEWYQNSIEQVTYLENF